MVELETASSRFFVWIRFSAGGSGSVVAETLGVRPKWILSGTGLALCSEFSESHPRYLEVSERTGSDTSSTSSRRKYKI